MSPVGWAEAEKGKVRNRQGGKGKRRDIHTDWGLGKRGSWNTHTPDGVGVGTGQRDRGEQDRV